MEAELIIEEDEGPKELSIPSQIESKPTTESSLRRDQLLARALEEVFTVD